MNQNDSFDPKKVYYRMTTPWKNTLERGQIDTNHVPSIEYIVGEAYQKFDSLVYSTNNVPLEK